MGVFFAGVEFLATVNIFSAGVAAHAEGGHEADCLLAVAALLRTSASKFAGVEVWGIVLAKDFSLGHGVAVAVLSVMAEMSMSTRIILSGRENYGE